jgi:benzoyl-CoA-dihydrodiol lyase
VPSKTIRARRGVATSRALNGASGGGYELAIACDEIYLVDDGNSAVSLPEVPLLGVLPGTGGLTRLVDKRKIRRDRADVFSTLAEGLKGKRAKEWGLIDDTFTTTKFQSSVDDRVAQIVNLRSDEATQDNILRYNGGIKLNPLDVKSTDDARDYKYVSVQFHRDRRYVDLTMRGPEANLPTTRGRNSKAWGRLLAVARLSRTRRRVAASPCQRTGSRSGVHSR